MCPPRRTLILIRGSSHLDLPQFERPRKHIRLPASHMPGAFSPESRNLSMKLFTGFPTLGRVWFQRWLTLFLYCQGPTKLNPMPLMHSG